MLLSFFYDIFTPVRICLHLTGAISCIYIPMVLFEQGKKDSLVERLSLDHQYPEIKIFLSLYEQTVRIVDIEPIVPSFP